MQAFALLFALILVVPVDEREAARTAIVRVGGCSGVCVDPRGLIMTAKHCELQEVETIQIGDLEFTAVRIYEAPGTEGPLVYDCLGGGFTWAPVAQSKPEPGDPVTTMGFPAIRGIREFREKRGTISGGARVWFEGEEFLGNTTDIEITEGWSGGPLLNRDGEVVGLANSSGPGVGSVFISHAATKEAFHAAQALHVAQPVLRVLVTPDNPECRAFLQDFTEDLDFQREVREHFQVLFVDPRQSPFQNSSSEVDDGRPPAFLLTGGAGVTGYQGKLDLLKRLLNLRQDNGDLLLREW